MKVRKLNKDQRSGSTLMDLPTDIISNILIRVSAKRIITCKCVCKAWNDLISDPEFVNKYSAQKKQCLLVKDTHTSRISRTLYSIEPEDCLGWCRRCKSGDEHNVSWKNKIKIPLRNVDHMFDSAQGDCNAVFHNRTLKNRKSLIQVNPENHQYSIANSCNGLLCLVNPQTLSDSVAVCNPITGEFVCYEGLCSYGNDGKHSVMCGLGFDTKNNRYKIVRMRASWIGSAYYRDFDHRGLSLLLAITSAEVHTIGTYRWRSLKTRVESMTRKNVYPPAPISRLKPHHPTYFCGALHWVFSGISDFSNCEVLSFELDEEQFQCHSVPLSPPCETRKGHNLAMVVLKDCLCICDNFGHDGIDIWMMKENGDWESWTKFVSIDIGIARGLCGGFYQPLFYLDNGALVLFNCRRNELVYYDQLGGLRFKYLRAQRGQPDAEITVHTPNSFISIKDLVKGSPVEAKVSNVNSRCGKLKLVEENNVHSIGGPKE